MANNNNMVFTLGIKTQVDMSGLNALKKSLKDLGSVDTDFLQGFSAEQVEKVTSSVRVLENALDSAFDINLNGINFNTFQKSIEKSGMSLNQIRANLATLGPEGTTAFARVTSQVYQLNTAVQYTNKFTDKLFSSFKNTIMYTGFNAMLNTATKTVSQAMGYIKDLDRSLNDIRIVTEKSADDMKNFAVQANNAAQALGTTTTNYTDASLIYYQQGLTDEEVTERTNVTIKMANALGSSADEVSEYMTAIWNNFDDGTKSLESFGDTITALGAATASSSEEIAQGLEKFAAVADTVGLSYEYATTALATVVAETRQSADIVGTAFKTLFARIQDLELGDTLDDGTTLGKYSQALDAVGINIKDANGNLKDMDDILDEMGSKWQSLSADTQVALAQTVAGTRQYTQLVALMSNWDKFQTNLKTAATAEGTLTKQNEIYMDSMQAHLNKLKAASEDLYSSLFDDKDIKNFYDLLTNLIKGVDHLVESFGGLAGIVPAALSLGAGATTGPLATLFSQNAMNNANQEMLRAEEASKLQSLRNSVGSYDPSDDGLVTKGLAEQEEFYHRIYENVSLLTKEEREHFNELSQAGAKLLENKSIVESMQTEYRKLIKDDISREDFKNFEKLEEIQNNLVKGAAELQYDWQQLSDLVIDKFADEDFVPEADFTKILFEGSDKFEGVKQSTLDNLFKKGDVFSIDETTGTKVVDHQKALAIIQQEIEKAEQLRQAINGVTGAQKSVTAAQETFAKALDDRAATKYWLDVGAGIGKAATGLIGISKIGQIWSNNDLDIGQKLLQTMTNMVFYFPIVSSGWKKIAGAFKDAADEEAERLKKLQEQKEQENNDIRITLEVIEENKKAIADLTKKYEELEEAKKAAEAAGDKKEANRINKEQKEVQKDINRTQKTNDSEQKKLDELRDENGITEIIKSIEDLKNPQETLLKGFEILTKKGIGGLKDAIVNKGKGLLTALNTAWKGLGILGPIAAGVGVAFVSAKVALAAYNSYLEKNAKDAEEAARKDAELAEKKKEEYENIKNLKQAYDELNESEDVRSTTELRNETYKLCLQYGEEELAVKSLSASYDELNSIIEDNLGLRSEEYKNSTQKAIESQKKSIENAMLAYAGAEHGKTQFFSAEGSNIALTSGIGIDFGESDYIKQLNQYASQYGLEDLITGGVLGGDYLNQEVFAELLAKDAQGFKDLINSSSNDVALELNEYIDMLGDKVDTLTTLSTEAITAIKESISNTLTSADVTSTNFLTTRKDIISELINSGLKQDEAEDEANKMLSQFSGEGLKNTQAYNLAEAIFGDPEGYFEEFAEHTQAELVFLAKFQNYFKTTNKDIDEFLEKYGDLANLVSDSEFAMTIPATLAAANGKGKFEEDEINALFPDGRPEIKLQTGLVMDRETFENSDFETQTRVASQALLEGLIDTSKNAETTRQAIADLKGELETLDTSIKFGDMFDIDESNIETFRQAADIAEDLFEEKYSTIDFSQLTDDQLNAIEELLTDGSAGVEQYIELLDTIGGGALADVLRENEDKIIEAEQHVRDAQEKIANGDNSEKTQAFLVKAQNDLAEAMSSSLTPIKSYLTSQGAVEKYTRKVINVTNELQAEIDALEAGTISASEANEEIEKQYKNIGSTIDMLQSQYSSLQSVVDDYNDNGKLSIDSIQSLVEMDNAFVASLELENGQLKINNETYSSLMDVQMAYMRQQVMADLITDLHVLKEGEAADATGELSRTYSELGDTALQTASKVAAGTELLGQFTKDVYGLAGLSASDFGVNTEAAEEAIQAAYNKLRLMGSVDYFEGTGGSGSGSSKAKDKEEKDFDDEYDRYWDINNAIEKVTHALSKLDKEQEKLSRTELISSLKAENELLEIQAQKYNDLAAEQHKEAAELREQLEGYGIIFDSEGQIQNYLAQTKASLEQYNQVVADYNAGNISDESFEAYEKDYNTFKEVLDKYDELFYNKMVETQDKLDDIIRQIKENNLTGWETELTLKLDTHQADRDWNDFIGKIEDNFKSRWTDFGTQFRTAVFDANSLGGEGGTIDDELKAAKEVMAEIDKMEAGGDSSMFESISQAQDKLKELQDQLVDDAGALFDLYQNGWDNYNSAIDEVIDKFGEVQNSIEAINADLNHQSKIIELLYGQQAYDFLDSLYNAQSKNYLTQLASLRDQNAFYQSQYEKAAAEYGADSDAAQKFKSAWDNAIKDLHAAEEAYLENLAKSYSNTVAKAFSDAEKKLMKGSSYNFVSEQWNLAKEAADGVYDDQEKIYQLEKLSLKYQEAIGKASTTKSQQKLQDLYESQVKSLEDRTTLTEYDITLAEKRLAVAQAEADLEDARNNKNALKVTRDTAGNWSYQYVADEGDLDDRQQALLDAQYEAYEYVKQNVSDLKKEMIKLAEDWSTTIADLEAKMIGATEEEKAQYQMMIDWYNDYYATQMNTKADELKAHEVNLAEETNALLATEYMVNISNYNLMIDSQKSAIDEMAKFAIESATDVYNSAGEAYDAIVEHGNEAMRETIDYFGTAASEITDIWSNNPDSVKNAMLEAMTICTQAQLDYGEAVREGCIAAGEDYADVEAQIYEDVEATEELQDATSDLVATATSELAEYESYLSFLEDAWYRVKDSVYENGIEMMDYINKLGVAKQAAIDFVSVLDEAIQKEYEFQRAAAGGLGGNGLDSSSRVSIENHQKGRYKVESQFGGNYGIWDTIAGNWVTVAGTGSGGYNSLAQELTKYGFYTQAQYESYKSSGWTDEEILKEIMKDSASANSPFANGIYGQHGIRNNDTGEVYKTFSTREAAEEWARTHAYNQGRYTVFASGGYTGNWNGENGKFAMLHQKELVLNADDTANMLEAVSIIRQLSGINSSIQSAIAESIAAALRRISGVNEPGNITNNSGSNNIYNINAEFPAANDVNDIREALLSLPNLAAQRTGLQTI